MFTGIVEETGRVRSFTLEESGVWRLAVEARVIREGLALGDSIAVNGCCLTAAKIDAATVTFDVLDQTRLLTNFRRLRPGAAVNLERSLRFDGKVGGHFVTGHIDGTGEVQVMEQRGADYYLRVKGPAGAERYVVQKGSVALDGVSLTVAETTDDCFAVWLIPTTLIVTNLASRRSGDLVNIEFDQLGKYVEKFLGTPRPCAQP